MDAPCSRVTKGGPGGRTSDFRPFFRVPERLWNAYGTLGGTPERSRKASTNPRSWHAAPSQPRHTRPRLGTAGVRECPLFQVASRAERVSIDDRPGEPACERDRFPAIYRLLSRCCSSRQPAQHGPREHSRTVTSGDTPTALGSPPLVRPSHATTVRPEASRSRPTGVPGGVPCITVRATVAI